MNQDLASCLVKNSTSADEACAPHVDLGLIGGGLLQQRMSFGAVMYRLIADHPEAIVFALIGS